jgi:thioesterase domain-containing protein/acyl carrier protein
VVLNDTAALESSESPREAIREYLKRTLPDYMVPVDVIVLQRMPVTSSGKVDRKNLPTPQKMQLSATGSYLPPSSDLEAKLVGIWQDVLKVQPIGVTDNFFDRGGHSLLVVRLLAHVEERFRREIPISAFFQKPTIRDLVVMMEEGKIAEVPPLVTIQRGGWRPPLFMVHALGGDVGFFSALAQHMGEDQPFYALQAPYPTDLKKFVSIEEMATRYVEEVCKVYSGPYHLGGYSFGSAVAFEMAQQLTRQGREVALLAFLEGGSPYLMKHLEADVELMMVAGLARDLARLASLELDLPHEQVQAMKLDEGLEFILDKLKRTKLLSERLGIPWMRRYTRGAMLRLEAIRRYSPPKYDGEITLFRSEQNEPETEKAWLALGVDVTSASLGWDPLCKRLVIQRVPGYHTTMVEEPHARVLGAKLRSAIDETNLDLN